MESKNPNIRYNEDLANEYFTKSEKMYRDGKNKEGNEFLIRAIENGYNKDVFKEKYVIESPVLENKYLNGWLISALGLQEDFDELLKKQRCESRVLK